MLQIFGGKVLNVKYNDEYEYVRVRLLVDGRKEDYNNMTLDSKILEFNIFKGANGFKELKSAVADQFVKIRGEVTRNKEYINVKIDGLAFGKKAYYCRPTVEEKKAKTARRVSF